MWEAAPTAPALGHSAESRITPGPSVTAVSDEYDTVIIGAGAAGLAAARMLAGAGQRVAILEARDRIGGRIVTHHVSVAGHGKLAVELGAEFIHGLPAETWDLVNEGHLATVELQGSQLSFVHNRLERHDATHDAAGDVLEGLKRWAQTRPGSDMTFADYLTWAGIGAADAAAAAGYVEGFNAADRSVIGAAALAKQQSAEDEIHAERLFHVREGYERIPQVLCRALQELGVPILLGRRVRHLKWRRGAVSIQTAGSGDKALHAKRAVITLPLGVLHEGSMGFSPQPTAMLSQAARMRMGTVIRVTLVFRSRFWRDDELLLARSELAADLRFMSFLFTPQLMPATWWTAMPEQTPIITGWVGGPKAESWQHRLRTGSDRELLLTESLRTLSTAFGLSPDSLRRELASWHTLDWGADEHSRGAYSYAPADALDASDKMSVPVAGTLYFAGEHTDTTGHWGTVHGALRSGLRAGRQVLADAAG
jgi:monoamine oxidase